MVAQRQTTTTQRETPNLRPIGRPGLAHSQGYIHEERVKELQGRLLADAVREMLDVDAKVGAERRAIDSLIKGVQWSIVAKDESEAAEDARTFVEEAFNDFDRPFTEIIDDALTHLYYGWAVLEVVYKHRDGDHPDRTRRSKYEDGKLGWRDWSIRAQDTRLHWEIDDEAGEATALVQTPAPDYKPITVPLERCLHFRTTSHKGNPEGRSVLRNAIQPWYYRKHLQTIEAIGVERDLAGLPVLKVPSRIMSASATADDKALYEQAKKIVTGIRRDEQEGVVMPSDVDPASGKPLFELTLLSSAGQRQFDVDKVIARYSLEILQTMLADFIQLGHDKVGSFALSSDKTSLFAVALGAVLDHLAAVINDVAIPRLLRVNAIPTKVWPTFQWGDIEARDVAPTVDAILKLTQAGMEIFPNPAITRHVLEMLDLPAPSLEELEAQAEEQQAQAAAIQQATLDGQKAKAEAIRQGKPTGEEKPPGAGPSGEDRATPTPNELPKRAAERAPFDLDARPPDVPVSIFLLADGSPDGFVDGAYVVYAAVDLANLERVLDEGLAPAVRPSDGAAWHRVATRRDEAVRLAEDEAPSAPVVLEYRLPFEAAERLLRRGYAAPDGTVLHALAGSLPAEYLAGEVRAFASKQWVSQPRVPKGSPEGGEWTEGGGGTTGGAGAGEEAVDLRPFDRADPPAFYESAQPRAPKGSPIGGRWTSRSGGARSEAPPPSPGDALLTKGGRAGTLVSVSGGTGIIDFGDHIEQHTLANIAKMRAHHLSKPAIPPSPTTAAPLFDSGTPAPGLTVPVGMALKGELTGEMKAALATAVEAIDQVHGDGVLPTIPVRKSSAADYHGVYNYEKVAGGRVAKEIRLSTHAGAHELTLMHEIGHFLDQQGLGEGKQFASSAQRPELDALQTAIGKSKAFQQLLALHNGVAGGGASGAAHHVSGKFTGYLLGRSELFARAYAQYIATRSGHPTLLAQLNAGLSKEGKVPVYYPMQWQHQDFAPIGTAFDGLFTAKGWRK